MVPIEQIKPVERNIVNYYECNQCVGYSLTHVFCVRYIVFPVTFLDSKMFPSKTLKTDSTP